MPQSPTATTQQEKLQQLWGLTQHWKAYYDCDLKPKQYVKAGAADLSNQIAELLLDEDVPIALPIHDRLWLVDNFNRVRCFADPRSIPWGQGRDRDKGDLQMCVSATLRERKRRQQRQQQQQQEAG